MWQLRPVATAQSEWSSCIFTQNWQSGLRKSSLKCCRGQWDGKTMLKWTHRVQLLLVFPHKSRIEDEDLATIMGLIGQAANPTASKCNSSLSRRSLWNKLSKGKAENCVEWCSARNSKCVQMYFWFNWVFHSPYFKATASLNHSSPDKGRTLRWRYLQHQKNFLCFNALVGLYRDLIRPLLWANFPNGLSLSLPH